MNNLNYHQLLEAQLLNQIRFKLQHSIDLSVDMYYKASGQGSAENLQVLLSIKVSILSFLNW